MNNCCRIIIFFKTKTTKWVKKKLNRISADAILAASAANGCMPRISRHDFFFIYSFKPLQKHFNLRETPTCIVLLPSNRRMFAQQMLDRYRYSFFFQNSIFFKNELARQIYRFQFLLETEQRDHCARKNQIY